MLTSTDVFILLSFISNFLLSKLVAQKLKIYHSAIGLLAVVLYALPGAIATSISKSVLGVSFRIVSLIFLFQALSTIFIDHFSNAFFILIANMLRGVASSILSTFGFTLMKQASQHGKDLKATSRVAMLLLTALSIVYCTPSDKLPFAILCATFFGFFYFYISSINNRNVLDLNLSFSDNINSFIKHIAIRFISTLLMAYLRPLSIIKAAKPLISLGMLIAQLSLVAVLLNAIVFAVASPAFRLQLMQMWSQVNNKVYAIVRNRRQIKSSAGEIIIINPSPLEKALQAEEKDKNLRQVMRNLLSCLLSFF